MTRRKFSYKNNYLYIYLMKFNFFLYWFNELYTKYVHITIFSNNQQKIKVNYFQIYFANINARKNFTESQNIFLHQSGWKISHFHLRFNVNGLGESTLLDKKPRLGWDHFDAVMRYSNTLLVQYLSYNFWCVLSQELKEKLIITY